MISKFDDKYFFLSNFYYAPITYDGVKYKCSECAFQAQKCKNEEDKLKFKNIKPSTAKELGNLVEIRDDWDAVKFDIMKEIVMCKFEQNEELKKKLVETGDEEIEEGNYWGDRYWGVYEGEGENHLGKILMEVREEWKTKQS